MVKITPQFVSSDSWILLAIGYCGQGNPVRLHEIIATADGINHAIPTADELDGALNRLLAADLIARQGDGFAMAEAGATMFSRVSKPRKPVLDVWDDLDKLIACPCCGPKLRAVRRQVSISKADVKKAYAAYIEMLKPERRKK